MIKTTVARFSRVQRQCSLRAVFSLRNRAFQTAENEEPQGQAYHSMTLLLSASYLHLFLVSWP